MKRLHTTNKEEIDLTKQYSQIKNYFKPEGLWYGIDSSWLNWVINNMPEKMGEYVFELDIDTNSLYRIYSTKDLLNFIKQYEIKAYPFTYIDWDKLAQKYSGIEINNYHKIKNEFRNFMHIWVLSWDVNSGCIWDLSIIKGVTCSKH